MTSVVKKTVILFMLATVGVGLYGCKCGRKYDTLQLPSTGGPTVQYFLGDCLNNIGITYSATYNNVNPFDVPVEADGVDTEARLVTLTNNNPSDKGCDLVLASAAMQIANDLHFDGFQDSAGNPLTSPIAFGSGASALLKIVAGPSTDTGLEINTLQVIFSLARTGESGPLDIPVSAWFVDNSIACAQSSALNPSTYSRIVPLDAAITENLSTSFSFVTQDCTNLVYQARVNRENDSPGFLTAVMDSAPAALTTSPVSYRYLDFIHSPLFGPPGAELDAYYIFSVDLPAGTRYFSKDLQGEFSVVSGPIDPCVASGVFSRTPTSISHTGDYGDSPSTANGAISYDGTDPASSPCNNRPYEFREKRISITGPNLLTINLVTTPRTGTFGTSVLNFNFGTTATWPATGSGQESENRTVELVLTDVGAVAAEIPVSAVVGQPVDPCIAAFSITPASLSLAAILGGAAKSGVVNVTFTPTAACTSTNFTASRVETGVAGNLASTGQSSGSLSTITTIPYNAILTPNSVGSTTHTWTLTLSTGGVISFNIDGVVSQDACLSALTITPSTLNLSAFFGGTPASGSVDVVFTPTASCSSINFTASMVEAGTPNLLSSSGPPSGTASTTTTFRWNAILGTTSIGSVTHTYRLTLSTGGVVTFMIVGNVTADPCLAAFSVSTQSLVLNGVLGGSPQSGIVNLTFTPSGQCTSTSFTASSVQTGTAGILSSTGPASGTPSSLTVYTYDGTLTPSAVGSVTDLWTITLPSGASLAFTIVGNVTQNPCAGALSALTSPDPIIASINGVDRFGDVVITNSSATPGCPAVDGTISLQSITLAGGTLIEVVPYNFSALLAGQVDIATSLARVAPGSVVETGMLVVTINYGVAGSGALTETATFVVNADVQALWNDCLTNVLDIKPVPDATLIAMVGSANVYRSIEFTLAPRCLTGADVSWLTQTVSIAGGMQLTLNSGSVSLDPGQTLTASNVVELIPGSAATIQYLTGSYRLTPRAPGAPSINLVGPLFTGIVTPPVAMCNITSPASGTSVSGTVPITFDVAVPSGVMNYRVDKIINGMTLPTLVTAARGGSGNPVTGAINGTYILNWDSIADGVGASDRQDAVIRLNITDTGSSPFATSCLVQLHVNNSAAASCSPVSSICGDVQTGRGPDMIDAEMTALIAERAPGLPSYIRCSDATNVTQRCLIADVDRDGRVTGVSPVVPAPGLDSGIIAMYASGLISQLTCNDMSMVMGNTARLPIECVSTLMTRDFCLAVPERITAAQLQSTGIRVYATDAQYPAPGAGAARIYAMVLRADGLSSTYSYLQLMSPGSTVLPTPYLVATPADVTVRSMGLLTYDANLLILLDTGVCGIVEVTP